MSLVDLEVGYAKAAAEASDMEGHMSTIRHYAQMCPVIAEFGVYDCTSTWALLAGHPQSLTSYDIDRRPEVAEVERAAADSGTRFEFKLGSSLDAKLGRVDLLFIDSFHTYGHLRQELATHASSVTRFIIMHDTETFGHCDQDPVGAQIPGRGLWPAVEEFCRDNPWHVREHFAHCHGLTVLERHGTTALDKK